MTDFIKNAVLYDGSKEIKIFKSNALVEGAFDLSPAEHDLMTLAINKLHSQRAGGKQVFISAKEFATANKINNTYAYEVLAETAKKLRNREFKAVIYEDGLKKLAGEEDVYSVLRPKGKHKPMNLHASWVQAVVYEKHNGFIYLMFSDVLAYLIQKTGESYTKYSYAKTIDLKGFHTKRLYELVNKWKGAKPTNGNKEPKIIMIVDEWKDFFGCSGKYDKTAEFKRRVLLPSIEKINEQKDFTLTLEQQKVGRIITHFSISIKDHQKTKKKETVAHDRNKDTIDWVSGLSDTEKQTITAEAEQYIEKQGITDEGHKQNIIKKATKERWGLDDHDKQQAENEKHKQQLEQERKREQEQKQKELKQKQQAEKELEECEKKFLLLNDQIQSIILDSIENSLDGSFKKAFAKERKKNKRIYADVMYSAKFKEIMVNF